MSRCYSRPYNRLAGQVCECLWLSRPACRRCPRSVGNKASFPPRSPRRLVLQGQKNSVVRSSREPPQVPAAAAQGPRPARPARPLSFCDLPLEGTSCSAQLGNKGHHSSRPSRGNAGCRARAVLLRQPQGSRQSGEDIPAKPAPACG